MRRDPRSEIIDKIAKALVSNGTGGLAKAYLGAFKPISIMGGVLLYFPMFPFLEVLGTWGHEFGEMLIDNPESNIDRIMRRIDELEAEKAEAEAQAGTEPTERKRGTFSSVKERIRKNLPFHS